MSLRRPLVIATMLLLAAGARPAAAEPVGKADGAAIFAVYCANCHGKSAKGDGPVAPLLRVRPANLTKLEKKGEFPTERIYEVIDGRLETPGHGYRDMPIWGLAFQDSERDSNQELEVKRRIDSLIDYLKSIQ
jgi:mono/diheme cytochrome c family protein